jgi:hypothetical protein
MTLGLWLDPVADHCGSRSLYASHLVAFGHLADGNVSRSKNGSSTEHWRHCQSHMKRRWCLRTFSVHSSAARVAKHAERLRVGRRSGRKRAGHQAAADESHRSQPAFAPRYLQRPAFRILAVRDHFTRECLALAAGPGARARARCHHCRARSASDVHVRERKRADRNGRATPRPG